MILCKVSCLRELQQNYNPKTLNNDQEPSFVIWGAGYGNQGINYTVVFYKKRRSQDMFDRARYGEVGGGASVSQC